MKFSELSGYPRPRAVVMAGRGIDQIGGHKNLAPQKNPRVVGRGDFVDEIRPASYFNTMAVNG
jgi:hypothetical protein